MIRSLARAIWPGEVHPETPPPFVSSGDGVPVVFEYARAKDEALTATNLTPCESYFSGFFLSGRSPFAV